MFCKVALFMRAWIEILEPNIETIGQLVALFMRAWIEILEVTHNTINDTVALFMRAWIEIPEYLKLLRKNVCRPLHEGVD